MSNISKSRRSSRLNIAKARIRRKRVHRAGKNTRICLCGARSSPKNLARHKTARLHMRRLNSKMQEDARTNTHSLFYDHPTFRRFKGTIVAQRTWEQRCAGQWICSYCGNLQDSTTLIDAHAGSCEILQEKEFHKRQRALSREDPYTALANVGMPLPCAMPYQRKYRYASANDVCALVVAVSDKFKLRSGFHGLEIILVDSTANWMRVRKNPMIREMDNYDYCLYKTINESVEELPSMQPGNIVQLHNVRFPPQAWTDDIVITSTKATTWAVYRLDCTKISQSRSCREEKDVDSDRLRAAAEWSEGFLCSWGLAAESSNVLKEFCSLFREVSPELGIRDYAERAIKACNIKFGTTSERYSCPNN